MAYQYPAGAMPQPVTYTSGAPYGADYSGYSAPGYSMPPSMPMPAMPAALDHAMGKWFAPGEALPPGFVVTSHPEGHTAPQQHHSMSNKAWDSFVSTGDAAAAVGSVARTGASASSSLKKSKKSKKKKSSGCC
ncbi:unnamed protein product [Effrenium voratum]|uniref:Uncharacterized protein n=2 Tax=Effrenium voratum TaxID=2562239 RepID=A0AA36JTI5_9DINO|nr:unnamed protein product [Effrenium voratum]